MGGGEAVGVGGAEGGRVAVDREGVVQDAEDQHGGWAGDLEQLDISYWLAIHSWSWTLTAAVRRDATWRAQRRGESAFWSGSAAGELSAEGRTDDAR